jgi:putative acetyltransferase
MMLQVMKEAPEAPDVVALLEAHLAFARGVSPRDAVHALDLAALHVPEITFWTARSGSQLAGCGALKELSARHGEIKSMHTRADLRGRGVGERIVRAILEECRSRGYGRVSLETGSTAAFAPARRLYARLGFAPCGPFGGYGLHPHSAFMGLELH